MPAGWRSLSAAGVDKEDLLGSRFPTEDSAAWLVMEAGHGVMIDYGEKAGLRYVDFGDFVPVGPIMAVPLTGAGETRGAIVVGRLTPQTSFTQADLEMAEAFAEQAALALELTDARANRERLAALENRDRIARDLHDHVIQRLFAAGLTAQSLAQTTTEPLIRDGLARTIGDLNGTIRQIRTTIFGLTDSASTATSLRRTVASIVDQMTPVVGFPAGSQPVRSAGHGGRRRHGQRRRGSPSRVADQRVPARGSDDRRGSGGRRSLGTDHQHR